MAGKRLTLFDDGTEPLATRIAGALHKVGLAMKQERDGDGSEGCVETARALCLPSPCAPL